jgi:peptide/nickel transport system permease protein
MGILIAWFFGFVLHAYTGLFMTGSMHEIAVFSGKQFTPANIILPALTLGIRPLAIIVQLTRSALLETFSMDFNRTARAKGLSARRLLFTHALPHALYPVVTAVTGWFAELLAGAFFVEYIFGWKGMGKITVDALEKLDYPVVMGSLLCTAFMFIVMNILSDLLYMKLDPRVRLE